MTCSIATAMTGNHAVQVLQAHLHKKTQHHSRLQQREELAQAVAGALDERHKLQRRQHNWSDMCLRPFQSIHVSLCQT